MHSKEELSFYHFLYTENKDSPLLRTIFMQFLSQNYFIFFVLQFLSSVVAINCKLFKHLISQIKYLPKNSINPHYIRMSQYLFFTTQKTIIIITCSLFVIFLQKLSGLSLTSKLYTLWIQVLILIRLLTLQVFLEHDITN